MVDRAQALGFGCANVLMQDLVARLVAKRPDPAPLREVQALARSALSSAGYDIVDATATMFVYARAPGGNDIRFVEALGNEGVLAMPSSLCHEPRHFRLALNFASERLAEAMPAFKRVRERQH
jgi:aspartate aminotransferase